ncbi:MAG: thiamine biosynthesis protein ThiS [Desulfobacteraceae bacterium 4572_35.1]|nr:MAG: thiamine biosynthesis protein ThiS [Desulfobacteraceae bacterium 4572_35.1]
MQIIVNNQAVNVANNSTIIDLINQLELDAQRIAIEHNRVILAPDQFDSLTLCADDNIEIVNFVGGG